MWTCVAVCACALHIECSCVCVCAVHTSTTIRSVCLFCEWIQFQLHIARSWMVRKIWNERKKKLYKNTPDSMINSWKQPNSTRNKLEWNKKKKRKTNGCVLSIVYRVWWKTGHFFFSQDKKTIFWMQKMNGSIIHWMMLPIPGSSSKWHQKKKSHICSTCSNDTSAKFRQFHCSSINH